MTENEVYIFYNEKVKVLYSEIEARNNMLPVELLFEIHAAFDHLKRFHVDGDPEERCAEKAFSHLKRGLLDALKLKLKYHNDDCNKLLGSETNLHLIDNGKFVPSMLSKRNEIMKLAKEARLNEGKRDIDEAFEKWYEVSSLIDEFEKECFDYSKIEWAKKRSFRQRIRENIVALIIGIAAGVIGSIVVSVASQFFIK